MNINYIGEKGTATHIVTELFANKDELDGLALAFKRKDGSVAIGWSTMEDEVLLYLSEALNDEIKKTIFTSEEEEENQIG